mmetsp:Transcript_46827/g.85770  ORF Transcript_46827/g.85770 Transcript_46827/m.85770 type:complete len:518 (+) Transcript_46827:100-1653(+)
MAKAHAISCMGCKRRWSVKLCICICIWVCEAVSTAPAETPRNVSDQELQPSARRMARRSSALIAVDADGGLHNVAKHTQPSHDETVQLASELAELASSHPAVAAAFADHAMRETANATSAQDDSEHAGGQNRRPHLPVYEMLNPFTHSPQSGTGEDPPREAPSATQPTESAAVSVDSGHALHSRSRDDEFWEKVGSAEVAAPSDGELQPAPEGELHEPPEPSYMKALEGIGASAFARSPAGSRALDRELRDRLQIQDVSALIFLAIGLGTTVLVTCFSVYKSAEDISPAIFYTEPSYAQPRMLCCSYEVVDFLQSFNAQPRSASLRIVGFRQQWRTGPCSGVLQCLQWVSSTCIGTPRHEHEPAFDVVLDLAPFIAGDGTLSMADQALLEKLLHAENPLLEIVVQKKVQWKMWEDVATNIRQRLRSLGFAGSIEISLDSKEEVIVLRNHRWSNFVRNPVTHALAVLSVVGIFLWKPYVWLRTERVKVEARFNINIEPARYWDLLSTGLDGAEGFIAS